MVAVGVLLQAVGGFAAGSFYIPFKKVREWAWESYWIVNGFFSWLVMPWFVAALAVPELRSLLSAVPAKSLFWTFALGLLWGVGGLTFGLSMRYLGMSLGYAIALGFCAAFGTLIPPIYNGTFVEMLQGLPGQVTLAGVLVCLVGIAICGWAGMAKERQLSDAEKKATIKEFSFAKGLIVAIFAGMMSACMALGIQAGKPIAALVVERGGNPLWQGTAVLVVVLAGGFVTNVVWSVFLNIKNRTGGDYVSRKAPLLNNYFFSALAGITWYFQFMFYTMGMSKMGKYDFSCWTLHMAFVIVFSNVWGLLFREWKGVNRRTIVTIVAGVLVVLSSTVVVGLGNYLEAAEARQPEVAQKQMAAMAVPGNSMGQAALLPERIVKR